LNRLFPSVLLLGGCLVAVRPVHAVGEPTTGAAPLDQATVAQRLSRAVTLYATDDDSSQAERLFLEVIRSAPVTTKDGATARYYLGRLYHRNYYMLSQSTGLERAAERYKEVHLKFAGRERGGTWYAEARFYKSLVYLEQGQWKDAVESIEHVVPALDPELEIDYLAWSLDKRPINKRVDTASFKGKCLAVLKANNVVKTRADGADRKTSSRILAELQQLLARWRATGT
jgi:tetratricopeptide (TPR) repeat protein